MERHANIIPRQMASERSGATLEVLPVTLEGIHTMKEIEPEVGKGTRALIGA